MKLKSKFENNENGLPPPTSVATKNKKRNRVITKMNLRNLAISFFFTCKKYNII
jgi:hypothetical protein